MKKYKFTVFTPTYNRAHLLMRLYKSLINQTFMNLEWIIVDDGSTDTTEKIVIKFIEENKIPIKYYKQENGGKHRAINKALNYASGELFFIVDSDDYLTKHSLETLVKNWNQLPSQKGYCGIAGLKGFSDGRVVGNMPEKYILDTSLLDYRYKYKIRGDKAEVFLTDILKEFKFPEIKGEKFISESIVWNKLGNEYKMRWINEIVYICDYLEGGLSSNSLKLRIENIEGTLLGYRNNLSYEIPKKYKIRSAINYYRFMFHSKLSYQDYKLPIVFYWNTIAVILGKAAQLADLIKIKIKF